MPEKLSPTAALTTLIKAAAVLQPVAPDIRRLTGFRETEDGQTREAESNDVIATEQGD